MRVKRARGRIAPEEREGVEGGIPSHCTLTPCNTRWLLTLGQVTSPSIRGPAGCLLLLW